MRLRWLLLQEFYDYQIEFLFDLTPDVQSIAVVGAVTAFSCCNY
jgi:hypothetical protein